MYYEINEKNARISKEMMSMRDYVEGSATSEYRAMVDKAARLVEEQKKQVSEFYHDKLDHLLDRYAKTLAEYVNRENQIGTMCPSIMISGGSNFPVRKKEKQVAAWEANRANYEKAEGILRKIRSVGTGPIDFADPHAEEMLADRINNLQAELDACKEANAYYRKHKTLEGCPGISAKSREWLTRPGVFNSGENGTPLELYKTPFPSYHLTSIRQRLKKAKERLEEYHKRKASGQESGSGLKFEGGEIVKNAELNRLQILFDYIPDEETRTALKQNGFRWSPSNKAWQRQLTDAAEMATKRILTIIEGGEPHA